MRAALQAAFGVPHYDEIQELQRGMTSTLVYCIVVNGAPYLLRVGMRKLHNPATEQREFTCMQAAADAGLAPRV